MSTRYHDILASSQGKRFATEADVNQFLDDAGLRDPTERIAAKLYLASVQASAELATDQTVTFDLASDRARQAVPGATATPELDHWMRRAGIDSTRDYHDAELTDLFRASDLDIPSRVAVRHHLGSIGRLRAGAGVTPTPRPASTPTRTFQASAPRRILRDAQGKPVTLKGYSW